MTTTTTGLAETRFRAMGTDVHLGVVGGADRLLDAGRDAIRDLERRWSRFVETSEVSGLNRHAGQPVVVSPATFDLVARAVAAWRATGGRFDPTVGAALVAHGYDRDFAALAGTVTTAPVVPGRTPGAAGIELLEGASIVRIPAGTQFDPGGLGKGLAADRVARLLRQEGAAGALVNVGGDLRVLGLGPTDEGWVVTVPDPLAPDRELLRLAMADGALATSSRLLRRWATEAGPAHHLIDPRTGRPADTDVVAVTVVATDGWWAEALTKSLFLRGPDGLAELDGAHAVVVTADGARHATDGLRGALR